MGEQPKKQKKLSYEDFLEQADKSNARLKKLRDEKRKSSKFGKPSPFAMRMRYWRPEEEARWIRMIPWSKNEEYYTFYQTWVKVAGRSRTVLCNCRAGEERVPCVVCHVATEQKKPDLIPSRKDAITVLVLENFHKVKQKSKAGNEYTSYEPCQGVDRYNRSQCEYCDDEVDKVFGHQYYWTLGYGHKLQLQDALLEIGEACANCHRGFISTWGYSCTECGSIVASHKEQDLDEEDVQELRTSDEIECPECGHVGSVDPQTECVHKKGQGSATRWVVGCDDPTPIANIWDLEFLVKVAGSETTSIVIEDWRPADDSDLEEWQLQTMDFNYFLSHEELAEQAKKMGRENPFDESAQEAVEAYFARKAEKDSDDDNVEDYDKSEGDDEPDDGPDVDDVDEEDDIPY